jgi:hypothetical protein
VADTAAAQDTAAAEDMQAVRSDNRWGTHLDNLDTGSFRYERGCTERVTQRIAKRAFFDVSHALAHNRFCELYVWLSLCLPHFFGEKWNQTCVQITTCRAFARKDRTVIWFILRPLVCF